MENMFELLKQGQEVIDAPGAGPLILDQGKVEFANVMFGYTPEKVILKNVSFTVQPGIYLGKNSGRQLTLQPQLGLYETKNINMFSNF